MPETQMPEMLLTFYCAAADRQIVAEALRTATTEPIHLRDEDVHGRDFGDAGTGEQVRGALRRSAIDLIAQEDAVDGLVAAVEASRRAFPVRWQTVAIARRGRIG
jgi:hypothetical protein